MVSPARQQLGGAGVGFPGAAAGTRVGHMPGDTHHPTAAVGITHPVPHSRKGDAVQVPGIVQLQVSQIPAVKRGVVTRGEFDIGAPGVITPLYPVRQAVLVTE